MSDDTKLRMTLHNTQSLAMLATTLTQFAKPWLISGRRVTVNMHTQTRKEAASDKFHALCGDIAKSEHTFHGKRRSKDEWKVLLISAHATATNEPTEFIPGLEGEIVNIRESTAAMGSKRMASLLEYTIAYCAMNRIPTVDDEETKK